MKQKYILYNPLSGNGEAKQSIEALQKTYTDAPLVDMQGIADYSAFFAGLGKNVDIILCGGDGTLNRFVNDIGALSIENDIYYYPTGTGNDFAKDLGYEKYAEPFKINKYLQDLPVVTVKGESRLFLNNVGFGIDGYCTEEGDKLRKENETKDKPKPINYTAIAIKGLLFKFKPRSAVITVDGKEYTYKKVWIAPCMKGRFYGGGMMAAPNQDRLNGDRKVSLMLFQGMGKLRALMIFPSIFKGEHIKHKKIIILEGHEITVTFDRPTPLQIDGETVLDVTTYSVVSSKGAKEAFPAEKKETACV